jgi:hypothetical protein
MTMDIILAVIVTSGRRQDFDNIKTLEYKLINFYFKEMNLLKPFQ